MADGSSPSRDERSVPDRGQLESAARTLLTLLDQAGLTLTTAESCTGGFLSSLLIDIEGLSHCLDRGYVCYSDAAKQDMLGIDLRLIADSGRVSEAVARAMAEHSQRLSGSGLAIAVTGVSDVSTADGCETAGVTFIGAAVPQQSWVYRVDYGDRPRREVRNMVTLAAIAIGIRTVASWRGE